MKYKMFKIIKYDVGFCLNYMVQEYLEHYNYCVCISTEQKWDDISRYILVHVYDYEDGV